VSWRRLLFGGDARRWRVIAECVFGTVYFRVILLLEMRFVKWSGGEFGKEKALSGGAPFGLAFISSQGGCQAISVP